MWKTLYIFFQFYLMNSKYICIFLKIHFCNILDVFTITFDQFNALLLNESINIFDKNAVPNFLKPAKTTVFITITCVNLTSRMPFLMWFVFLFPSLSVNLFPILRLLINSIINIRFTFYLLIWPIRNISHLTYLTNATCLCLAFPPVNWKKDVVWAKRLRDFHNRQPDVNHFHQRDTVTLHDLCPMASFIFWGGIRGLWKHKS